MNKKSLLKYTVVIALLFVATYAVALPMKKNVIFLGGSTSGGGSDTIGWTSDANTLIWGMTGGASANDTGAGGGLSGADLVATQNGNVPGSTGSPPYRQLTAASVQYFTHTATAGGLIAANGGAGWTVGFLLSDFTAFAGAKQIYWYDANTAGKLRVMISLSATNEITFRLYDVDAGLDKLNASTTGQVPATGYSIIMIWYNGTVFRAGFTAGSALPPTKWSDFAAANRVTNTATSNAVGPASGIGASDSGGSPCTVKIHQVMISKTCKINNAL